MNLDQCDEIFSRALAAETEAHFCHEVRPLFDFYQVLSVALGRGNIMWRARVVEGSLWPNLSDLDYPPPEHARKGRLNDAGHPCFYVAKDLETALLEIGANEGQVVQVAGYRVLADQNLRLILIGEYASVQKTGYLQLTGVDPDRAIQRILNGLPKGEALAHIYIDRFFASILNDPDARSSGYMFSRALGTMLHGKIKEADGIAFPSVRDPGGFNFAVHPEPSDRTFQNVACLVVKVGKERRFRLLDHEAISSATGLDSGLGFIWPPSYAGSTLNLYGMTKEEFDFAAEAGDHDNAMLNLFSMYTPRLR